MEESIEVLQQKRKSLCHKLEKIGAFRRGIISVNYRKCGKKNCLYTNSWITVIKDVLSALGQVKVKRACYYDNKNGKGFCPKDKALDLEGTSYSPGVRRMMSKAAACRGSKKRPQGDRARERTVRQRPEKPSWGVFLHRQRLTKKADRYGMNILPAIPAQSIEPALDNITHKFAAPPQEYTGFTP